MLFYDRFNIMESNELLLKIIEKNSGDNTVLPFYYFDIIRKEDNVSVSKISARIGENFHSYFNGNIGYEVFEQYRGNSIAYEACTIILEIFRAHNMKYVYLTCNKNNIASYKTIERLGAELLEVCNAPREYFAWYEGMDLQRIYKLVISYPGGYRLWRYAVKEKSRCPHRNIS